MEILHVLWPTSSTSVSKSNFLFSVPFDASTPELCRVMQQFTVRLIVICTLTVLYQIIDLYDDVNLCGNDLHWIILLKNDTNNAIRVYRVSFEVNVKVNLRDV